MTLLLLFPDLGVSAASYQKNDRNWLDDLGNLVTPFGAIRMPNWNDAGVPSSPVEGMYGFNDDHNHIEYYNGSKWIIYVAGEGDLITITTDYNMDGTNHAVMIDASSGNVTLTMPSDVENGHRLIIKRIDSSSNTVTIDGNGNTIDGETTLTIPFQYDAPHLIGDGNNWNIT